MPEVYIPYTPRPWQLDFHKAITKHRFGVPVCHRRAGKTVASVNQLVAAASRCKRPDGRYGYIAPFLKQAKRVAWSFLKTHTKPIPGRKVNEAELLISLPNGSQISVNGADNPDGLRGDYFDGVVVDEFPIMKGEVWGEVLRPMLADRKGWALFPGTPKGMNAFYELHENAKTDPAWWTGIFRADETGVLDDEELALCRQTMTDAQYRQEMLCDFTASSDDILITIDMVSEACRRAEVHEAALLGLPKIMAADIARFGDDSTVVCKRHGHVLYEPTELRGLDNMHVAGVLAQEWERWQPDACFIDGGRGEGVIDRLRQLGFSPVEVNAGSTKQVIDPHYANKKTEMADLAKHWIEECGVMPNHARLKTDVCSFAYNFNGPGGTMRLEKSDETKKRLGHSPDFASAFFLTFAFPVQAQKRVDPLLESQLFPAMKTDYDPYPSEAA